MKNNKIWLGILAMTLAFGITVVSCSSDDGDGPTGGNAGIPGTADGSLSITNQQVWVFNNAGNLVHYDGVGSPHTIVCENVGGTGTISAAGILTFNLAAGAITPAMLESLEDAFEDMLDDRTTFSVTGAQAVFLDLAENGGAFWLSRELTREEEVANGYNYTDEFVSFIYVDRNVTVSHPGGRFPNYYWDHSGIDYTNIATLRAFRIYLQQGWNIIRWHDTGTFRETSATTATYNSTWSLYADNPARLRWVKF